MSQFYATSLTYERFVSALGENHSQISLIDGQIKETSIYSTAKRFVGEVAAQTAVDVGSGVKQAAVATANAVPEIAKGVVSSLPWIAIGLGALALLYVAKVVRP